MKLKDLLSPFILLSVGLAFVLIAFLVYITMGKSKKLIASKIKIGAFLLSFSWFVAGCDFPSTRTCYAPALLPDIKITNPIDSITHSYTFKPKDTVYVQIDRASFYYYSFVLVSAITDSGSQSGYLVFDANKNQAKYYHFILDSVLAKGAYFINYFGEDSLKSSKNPLSASQIIHIK